MFISQYDKRRNCGQIAVAALTEAPLKHVTELCGKRTGTATRHLVKALRALGYECPDKMQRIPVEFGIAQLHYAGRSGWHWIALGHGLVFDGMRSRPMPIAEYEEYQRKAHKARITSFLPVTIPKVPSVS